jgi:hypothetical protein
VGVLQGDVTDEDARLAAAIVARYADTPPGESIQARVWDGDEVTRDVEVVPLSSEQVREHKV